MTTFRSTRSCAGNWPATKSSRTTRRRLPPPASSWLEHAELADNLMEEERIRTRFNELDDMIATTGSAMLGLTLGCARCHDHKYDPVPRRDYYRLLSAFNGGDRAEVPLAPLEEVRRHREAEAKWKEEFEPAKQRFDDWLKEARKTHE